MEYGLIPNIDQFRDNKAVEIEQVNASTAGSAVGERNKLQDVQKEEFLKADSASEVQKASIESNAPKFEVVLTNTNFGFNNSSQDFFVRAQRGNAENQYPTEDMMRLKSFLMNQDNQAS